MAGNWLVAAVVAALITATGLAPANAAAPRDLPTVAKGAALGDPLPDRLTPFPGGIVAQSDVVYSTVPGFRPIILDLYRRPDAPARPLVIYIHGGGWVAGHTRQAGAIKDFPAALAGLAAEGFTVASLEYRLAGEAPHPAQVQDVRAAIRFLKANAARFGIDPSRIALWGGSAGGHLAALAAASCNDSGFDVKATTPPPAGDTCVQAAAIWYGVFDFAPILARQSQPGAPAAENQLLGCIPADCPADRVANASPAHFFTAKTPPFLLIHGINDRTVPVDQSRLAETRLKALGVPVTAIYIPDVDHSFLGADAATTHAATMQAINATFDFFHTALGVRK